MFEFFRNTSLDATQLSILATQAQRQFNLNQFGGSLGGALEKDKTFFFVDYEAKRQVHGQPFIGLMPTPAMISGDFTLDPLGGTRGVNLYNNNLVFPNLVNPYIAAISFNATEPGIRFPPIPTAVLSQRALPAIRFQPGIFRLA